MKLDTNAERELAKDYLLHTKENLFLTGRAGSGKTTLLKEIIDQTDKSTVIVAPTGVAAINAGGATIHSFFQLPPSNFLPTSEAIPGEGYTNRSILRSHLKYNADKRALFKNLEMLVIDEISMVRADLLDAMDFVLRYVRGSNQPFGNVQIVMVGDLYQLPPVVKDEEWEPLSTYYNTPYFFDALVWKQVKMVPLELKKVYRQKDEDFLHLLNRIRDGKPQLADLELLNTRYLPEEKENNEAILLTTHNYKANRVNQTELDKIKKPKLTFTAKVSGKFNEWAYPAAEKLILKKGARVMFIRNDKEGRYYNGKLAEVIDFDKEKNLLEVKYKDVKDSMWIEQVEWENRKYKTDKESDKIVAEVAGSFTQFPLRLAWAVTVHKSQGLTLEAVQLDLEGSFAAGQAYVALSRCTSLEGLVMKTKLQKQQVIIDHRIRRFYEGFPGLDVISRKLPMAKRAFALQRLQNRFNLTSLLIALEKWKKYIDESGFSEQTDYVALSENIQTDLLKLQTTTDDFQQLVQQWAKESLTNPDRLDHLMARSDKAIGYFTNLLFEKIIQPLHQHISDIQHQSRIKKYLNLAITLYDATWRKIEALYQTQLFEKKVYQQTQQHKKADLPDWKSARLQTKKKKGATFDITLTFFREGLSITEIAEKRSLTKTTIESHLTKWLKDEVIDIKELLTEDRLEALAKAKNKVVEYEGYKDLREKLDIDCSYSELGWIVWYTENKQMKTL